MEGNEHHCYQVDPKIMEDLKLANEIQLFFLSISEDAIFEKIGEFKNLNYDFVHSEKLIKTFVNHLLNYLQIRPLNVNIAARFFTELIQIDEYKILKNNVLNFFFNKFGKKYSFPTNSPSIAFIYKCYELGIYTKEDIYNNIVEIYHRIPNLFESFLWFLFWFGPEIEEIDKLFYQRVTSVLRHQIDKNNYNDLYLEMFKNTQDLKKDNWKNFKEMRAKMRHPNKLAQILQDDDLEHLKELFVSPSFDVNQLIPESFLEPVWMLHFHPSLIQYAAFYNATKCFNFLMMNDADLNYLDDVSRFLPQFAICNGNIEIYRICEQNSVDVNHCDHTAIAFHFFDIFLWIHETKHTDLTDISPGRGSALSRIMSEWNYQVLFYCLDENIDLGFQDNDGISFYNL